MIKMFGFLKKKIADFSGKLKQTAEEEAKKQGEQEEKPVLKETLPAEKEPKLAPQTPAEQKEEKTAPAQVKKELVEAKAETAAEEKIIEVKTPEEIKASEKKFLKRRKKLKKSSRKKWKRKCLRK